MNYDAEKKSRGLLFDLMTASATTPSSSAAARVNVGRDGREITAKALREAYRAGRESMREEAAVRVEAMVPDASESRSATVRKATDWIAAWVTATAAAVRALPAGSES